jgi:hypothetical protein
MPLALAACCSVAMLLAIESPAGAFRESGQTRIDLGRLTVPADRLPDGCQLKSMVPEPLEPLSARANRSAIRVMRPAALSQPPGIDVNPWIGIDRSALAWLRRQVDGHQLRLPDAPPLSVREQAALNERFADGIDEGYAATYRQESAPDLGVHAVRYGAGVEPRTILSEPVRGRIIRLDLAAVRMRVVLYGDAGRCSRAIEAYLRALAQTAGA